MGGIESADGVWCMTHRFAARDAAKEVATGLRPSCVSGGMRFGAQPFQDCLVRQAHSQNKQIPVGVTCNLYELILNGARKGAAAERA